MAALSTKRSLLILVALASLATFHKTQALSLPHPSKKKATAMRSPTRRAFVGMASLVATLFAGQTPADAFSSPTAVPSPSNTAGSSSTTSSPAASTVAYKTVPLPLTGFGINAPLAVWYPVSDEQAVPQQSASTKNSCVKYDYQISVRRIGELLAKWEFIPGFVNRKFAFERSSDEVNFVDAKDVPIPTSPKVVVLTHGFLGSRFDLSHIAEDLASKGFVCVAPEYPESLEASYPRLEGLDRKVVNDRVIQWVTDNVPGQPSSWSSIGHSMGAGTAVDIGDDTWNRVLMGIGRAPDLPGRAPDLTAKFPLRQVGGRVLFISSVNDGAVKWGGGIRVPEDYTMLQESQLGGGRASMMIPDRAALVFDRSNAPNHISFLSENVNDAMVSFLSPLLPVAQAFEIPVLDFDKYVVSRDSVQTAAVLKPLISDFLLAADAKGKQR